MASTVVFYIIASILVISALMVVTLRNIFHAALYLAMALSMVAGVFVLLGADFLAAVQILLYVGGILVVIAFAVMLSSVYNAQQQSQSNDQWLPAILLASGLFLILGVGIRKSIFLETPHEMMPTTQSLGHLLLQDMALPFEVVSLILLASLVGAVIFSRPNSKKEGEQ